MTKQQAARFKKLCEQIATLHAEIRETVPNAEIFLEDGSIDLYDWPPEDPKPGHPIATGAYWPNAGGGGR